MFMQRQHIQEIRLYEAEKEALEIEDLLREIFNEKPLYKAKIKEIEKRIENLVWSCVEIM